MQAQKRMLWHSKPTVQQSRDICHCCEVTKLKAMADYGEMEEKISKVSNLGHKQKINKCKQIRYHFCGKRYEKKKRDISCMESNM